MTHNAADTSAKGGTPEYQADTSALVNAGAGVPADAPFDQGTSAVGGTGSPDSNTSASGGTAEYSADTSKDASGVHG